tara:strand:+ start:240 stop:470 length:231 start_codon:yes stop_codon:yes gene_type:complete
MTLVESSPSKKIKGAVIFGNKGGDAASLFRAPFALASAPLKSLYKKRFGSPHELGKCIHPVIMYFEFAFNKLPLCA